ncbi:LAMI_0E06062g1_1 [Lachancea mirantina]|uniref:LAMI_0E06062g1_1 n=1 Tax=Lachancea mirantina TaxID=1230905 RepID=A0A1G4JLM8_9SACH|nr:LAMI_0E06062g1_1 [Lachancea mirantina]
MNQIRSLQRLSRKELESGILSSTASWHDEYKDWAYIYIGGLNKELTEGDILTVFSQYGVPVDLKLVRDRDSGESKGFGFLKYEDQRSTILAVDNLNGTVIAGRTIKVDHTFYRPRKDEEEYADAMFKELERDIVGEQVIGATGEEDVEEFADPMAGYLRGK